MGREKVLLENLSEVLDVFVKTSRGVTDFVGSVNKCPDETKFVGIRRETEIIGQEASEGQRHQNFLSMTFYPSLLQYPWYF